MITSVNEDLEEKIKIIKTVIDTQLKVIIPQITQLIYVGTCLALKPVAVYLD